MAYEKLNVGRVYTLGIKTTCIQPQMTHLHCNLHNE